MRLRQRYVRRAAVVAAAAGLIATTFAPGAQAAEVRGFDGTTIKVASLGIKAQLPGVEWGAKARIKRFNDTNELKGIKIEYVESADDKGDPATALSEARRLVTDQKVFALVGDLSANNPGAYFKQQKVPYFGYAFDNTYCTKKPDKTLWGFGFSGCLVPSDPSFMPDTYAKAYKYVTEKSGKKHPVVATFSSDTTSGRNSAKFSKIQLKGAGFKVVYAKGTVAPPPVSDYAPYVQQLLTSNKGGAPDMINCLLAVDCIPIYKGLVANNYQGIYLHTLYSDALLEPFKGSLVNIGWANFADSTPALEQMKADVKAVNPDQALEVGSAGGYFSTDMFISALKKAAKKGTSAITPENVRKAASTQTWRIKGLVGPTKYPAATVKPTPQCSTLAIDDGTQWKTLIPFSCSSKAYKIKKK